MRKVIKSQFTVLFIALLLASSFSSINGQIVSSKSLNYSKNIALKPMAWQAYAKAGAYLLVSVKNLSNKQIKAIYLARIIEANQVEMTTELGKYSLILPAGKTGIIKIPVAKFGMRSADVAGAKGAQLVVTIAAKRELVPTSILYADGNFESTE